MTPWRLGTPATRSNGLAIARPAVLGLAKLVALSLSGVASAAPLKARDHMHPGDGADHGEGPAPWVLYVASAILVLLGGAFAGLTIASVDLPFFLTRDHATRPCVIY